MSKMYAPSVLVDIARALDAAPPLGRGQVAKKHADALGVSVQTLYRQLPSVGWSSGRKTRSDYGQRVMSQDEAALVAALKREGSRKNGKRLISTEQAAMLAHAAGVTINASRGTIDRTLRVLGMQADRLAAPSAAVELRSLHPNHVQGVDPSLCLVYYMNGRQHIMEADRFYHNKLENYAKVKTKVWRYLACDHTSAVISLRYYQVDGENQATLYDFLMWCWQKQQGRTQHGLPKILMMDAGSANKANAIRVLCEAFGVRLMINKPGNPRAKGFVEKPQDIVERGFESLLRFNPVETVEELNRYALEWQELFNANLLPRKDTRLHRPGMAMPAARIDIWQTIKQEEIIACPSREIGDWLMQGQTHQRTLDGRRRISYRHPKADKPSIYDLHCVPNLHPRDRVDVVPLIVSSHGEILIRMKDHNGEDVYHPVLPIADFNSMIGFRDSSPVIGEEYKAVPKSDADRTHDAIDRAAYGLDEDGVIRDAEAITKAKAKGAKPFAHLNDGQGLRPLDEMSKVTPRVNLPKRTTPAKLDLPRVTSISDRYDAQLAKEQGYSIDTPGHYDAASEHIYTVVKAAQLMRARIGEEEWTAQHFIWLQENFPEGLPETRFEEALVSVRRAGMRIANGGAA